MATNDDFANRYGPWAVVTGASSGIGEQLARILAERGCNVILVARRVERLQSLSAELERAHAVQTMVLPLDLAGKDSVDTLLAACEDKDVGLVACNAGLGAKGLHHETPRERIEAVIAVNCFAPAVIANAFLPRFIERGRGALLITGSIEAYVGFPHSATYSASKAFVRAMGEAIWSEAKASGVDVLVLAPGATDTEILPSQGIQRERMTGLMDPRTVARQALDHLGSGPHYVPGIHNRLMVGVLGLLPRRVAIALAGIGMRGAIAGSRN